MLEPSVPDRALEKENDVMNASPFGAVMTEDEIVVLGLLLRAPGLSLVFRIFWNHQAVHFKKVPLREPRTIDSPARGASPNIGSTLPRTEKIRGLLERASDRR